MTVADLVSAITDLITGFIPAANFVTLLFAGVVIAGGAALAARMKRLGK